MLNSIYIYTYNYSHKITNNKYKTTYLINLHTHIKHVFKAFINNAYITRDEFIIKIDKIYVSLTI